MKLTGLYKVKRTGVWYYQPPMAKGVRPKAVSLETKDEEEALQKYLKISAEAAETFRRGSLRMEIARYIQEMRAKKKHTTATSEHSETVLKQIVDLVGNLSVDRVALEHMQAVKGEWQDRRKLSESTIASYFSRVSAFFAWAKDQGLTKTNPVEGLHYERSFGTRSERYCTKQQRDAIVACAPVNADQLELLHDSLMLLGRWQGPLVRIDVALCLWLGFFAGLRRNEIVEARRDWIDLEGGVVHVRRTETFVPKGKKNRIVRMSPRLRAFLAHYIASVDFDPHRDDDADGGDVEIPTGGSAYLLRPDRLPGRKQRTRGKKAWRYRFDPRAPFEAHCTAAGLPWVTFHVMRHTFGTLHALAGTPLSTIARELGDQLRVVEATYIGYTKSDSHSAAAD